MQKIELQLTPYELFTLISAMKFRSEIYQEEINPADDETNRDLELINKLQSYLPEAK